MGCFDFCKDLLSERVATSSNRQDNGGGVLSLLDDDNEQSQSSGATPIQPSRASIGNSMSSVLSTVSSSMQQSYQTWLANAAQRIRANALTSFGFAQTEVPQEEPPLPPPAYPPQDIGLLSERVATSSNRQDNGGGVLSLLDDDNEQSQSSGATPIQPSRASIGNSMSSVLSTVSSSMQRLIPTQALSALTASGLIRVRSIQARINSGLESSRARIVSSASSMLSTVSSSMQRLIPTQALSALTDRSLAGIRSTRARINSGLTAIRSDLNGVTLRDLRGLGSIFSRAVAPAATLVQRMREMGQNVLRRFGLDRPAAGHEPALEPAAPAPEIGPIVAPEAALAAQGHPGEEPAANPAQRMQAGLSAWIDSVLEEVRRITLPTLHDRPAAGHEPALEPAAPAPEMRPVVAPEAVITDHTRVWSTPAAIKDSGFRKTYLTPVLLKANETVAKAVKKIELLLGGTGWIWSIPEWLLRGPNGKVTTAKKQANVTWNK